MEQGKEHIELYYTSGTGAAAHSAHAMASVLRRHGRNVVFHRIEFAEAPETGAPVLVFPIIEGGTFEYVWRFLENLPPGAGKPAAFLGICEGSSRGFENRLHKFLEEKGYRPNACRIVSLYDLRHALRSECAERTMVLDDCVFSAMNFALELINGKGIWEKHFTFGGAAKRSQSGVTRKKLMRRFALSVGEMRCTQCGICRDLCPVGAIALSPFPKIASNCESCLRCVACCPEDAFLIRGKPAQIRTLMPFSQYP